MRYGISYKGSKNTIAEKICQLFPKADNFYDLFAGGCAITHRAMIEGKFKNYIINDLYGGITQLFINAIHGKYKDEKRWISREDFFRLKDTDPYVAICWSFGNNGIDYLYSRDKEPWKKAVHYARVLGDNSLLMAMGINSDGSREDIRLNEKDYKEKYKKWYLNHSLNNLENLERLQSLERLERLQSLENLERLEKSYNEVDIKPNSVIYCDIPYINTDGYYGNDFDHLKFYSWAEKQKEIVYISSYWMPEDRFCKIKSFTKAVTLCSGRHKTAEECVFIPRTQIDLYNRIKEEQEQGLLFPEYA